MTAYRGRRFTDPPLLNLGAEGGKLYISHTDFFNPRGILNKKVGGPPQPV